MSNSSQVTSIQICSHYGISAHDFINSPTSERALFRGAYAADVLKVTEQPIGSNSGPDVDRYLAAVGLESGEPWCMAFAISDLIDSGVPRNFFPDGAGSTHVIRDWAHEKGFTINEPIRGAIGIIIESPTSGHCVRVTGPADSSGNVHTIEGNTNNDGSREGYGVFRRVRSVGEIDTWIDPKIFN